MQEIGRILISIGLVVASTGLIVYGMGVSYVEPRSFETTLGLLLMIGGVIASVIGGIVYRQTAED